MQADNFESRETDALRREIQELKNRINLMEASLDIRKLKKDQTLSASAEETDDDFDLKFTIRSDDSIEFRLGEYGMAWLGNIVLLFGITFLVQYLQNSGQQFFSTLIGFVAVTGIYAGSYFTQISYSYLSKLLAYNGHILLYYMVLLLHFSHGNPVIQSESAGVLLVILVTGILFYSAFRQKSQVLAGLVLIMLLVTGIIAGSFILISGLAAAAAILVVLLYERFGWIKLAFLFVFLIYTTHLNGLLNNPLAGHNLEFIAAPGIGNLFLIITGFTFSLLALLPKKEPVSNDFIITTVVWNGLFFTLLLALTVVIYLSKNYVPLMSVISLFCLGYAILLQRRSALKITASMYALYGFLAMSVAFYGILQFPKAYMLFAIQSLLVVSMALWFRSRFIVVMNTLLFILLFIFYLTNKVGFNSVNFSFMLVALITARIINWKKERLNIKTELIRNIYLITGFTMTLIAFHHAFPESYITGSWIVAALLFFLMSRLINNIKYRWLAIAALLASAIKLIFVDLKQIDIGLRVLMFLLLAIISITISILYTKYLTRKKE